MRHAIVTTLTDTNIDFTPTIIIGFYVGGYEDRFFQETQAFRQKYTDTDIIGCSSESNLFDELPHIDAHHQYPCIYMCLDIPRTSYRIRLYEKDSLLDKSTVPDGNYGAILLHTGTLSSQLYLENLTMQFQELLSTNLIFGAIAAMPKPLMTTKPTLYHNGVFYENNTTLVWFIDQTTYRLEGISLHDFDPIGYKMEVTRMQGNTLIELDHKPALATVESVYGELTEEGISSFDYPFFLYSKNNDQFYHKPLCSILSIDRADQTITLYREIREGDHLKLSIAFDREKQELQFARLKRYRKANEMVALGFICIAYKGHWAEMESVYLMRIKQALHSPFIGLHTFGEIGPFSLNDPSQLQNQTVTLCLLSQRSMG